MLIRNAATPPADWSAPFRSSPARPLALLRQCPVYGPTPLRAAPDLAKALGVNGLWLKDETRRMGLGSFKALGGAFALAQIILDRAGGSDPKSDPMSDAARAVAAETTFITASAGNHGLSVAAGARVFGAKAQIVLSSGVPEAFADRIREIGATVLRVDGSYEDSVAEAARVAETNGWVHLADGSWEGYIEPPALVMEGYTVLAEECRQSFEQTGGWPSHVLLQAGVGGLAAAVAAHIRAFWAEQPQIIIVEPEAAPCLLQSIEAGRLTSAIGPVSTMGRLDCKNASLLAFETLRRAADMFVTITDDEAAEAVSALSRHGIESTPSGAAALAAIPHLGPGPDATCLVVVSEGAEGG